jgi:predicted outer membrane lipoprotein
MGSEVTDWVVIFLLGAKTRVTPIAAMTGLLFAVLVLARIKASRGRLAVFLLLWILGTAMACLSFGILTMAYSVIEPPGEARGWLRFYSKLSLAWCLLLVVVAGLASRGLSVPTRSAVPLRVLARTSVVMVPFGVLVFYSASRWLHLL